MMMKKKERKKEKKEKKKKGRKTTFLLTPKYRNGELSLSLSRVQMSVSKMRVVRIEDTASPHSSAG